MSNYEVLIRILDEIRDEAPSNYRTYHPDPTNQVAVDQARARAYIHLFLKVRFGLLEFVDRERFITDETSDGGIDAYYIDTDNKRIYFIQSKFRTNEINFSLKPIELDDIVKMDVERVTRGMVEDANGTRYNGKIQRLIRDLQDLPNIARYDYEIILLANIIGIPLRVIERVLGHTCSVFDHQKCYDDLVFPVVAGTFYNPSELTISIDLSGGDVAPSQIHHLVKTDFADCDVSLLYVPTAEIGRIMHTYKNSILRYNPRSYLGLSNNPVNREIEKTIVDKSHNEFSLLNNGITMVSDQTDFTQSTGRRNEGQLLVKNPQIINGGQTAYTLANIYEDAKKGNYIADVFGSKEVMMRVITILDVDRLDPGARLNLIELVSRATNQQSPVEDADRLSNDAVQIDLQQRIFKDFGYFYERKRGEFHDGLASGYISQDQVIERELLVRLCYAIAGKPDTARSGGKKSIFNAGNLNAVLNERIDHSKLFFGYLCFKGLNAKEKEFGRSPNNRYGILNYGSALRYGKYAAVAVACNQLSSTFTASDVQQLVTHSMNKLLARWLDFEKYAIDQPHNRSYFYETVNPETGAPIQVRDFDSYYKVSNLPQDLGRHFGIKWHAGL